MSLMSLLPSGSTARGRREKASEKSGNLSEALRKRAWFQPRLVLNAVLCYTERHDQT